jgi:hypothetical protein
MTEVEFGCGENCERDDQCFAALASGDVTHKGDFVLGGPLWAPSLDLKNSRFDLHWLYLAMSDIYMSSC